MHEVDGQTILWKPNPGPQTEALKRTEFEILYGGARGGGKTDAGLAWLSRWINIPDFRALVVRRNADDLSDWVDRAGRRYKHLGVQVVGKPPVLRFPSGAIIKTGHLHDDSAYTKYQGHEYQKMLIEELTHIPSEDLYLKLTASCRSTIRGLKPQIFCTTNPGEVGHAWVKKRFVDVIEPMTRFIDATGITRVFIPSRVYDNPKLLELDPNYVKRLEGYSPEVRQRWLEGSWDDIEVEGAYYTKWLDRAQKEERISTFPLDPKYPVNTAWDLGISDSTAIWFFQIIGQRIRLLEYYEGTGEGLDFYIDLLDHRRKMYGYNYASHYAPHDIAKTEFGTGKTILEQAHDKGIEFNVIPKLRVADGIEAVRMVLDKCEFDAIRCETGIHALKNYRKEYDDVRLTFKDKPRHDFASHGSDAFRYLAVSYYRPDLVRVARTTSEVLRDIHENQILNTALSAFSEDRTMVEIQMSESEIYY